MDDVWTWEWWSPVFLGFIIGFVGTFIARTWRARR